MEYIHLECTNLKGAVRGSFEELSGLGGRQAVGQHNKMCPWLNMHEGSIILLVYWGLRATDNDRE